VRSDIDTYRLWDQAAGVLSKYGRYILQVFVEHACVKLTTLAAVLSGAVSIFLLLYVALVRGSAFMFLGAENLQYQPRSGRRPITTYKSPNVALAAHAGT